MRAQLVKSLKKLMADNDKIVVILGDIGEWGFREIKQLYAQRIYNVGINEQAMIGLASGLAKEGFLPVVYTISPFLIERAYEQIKIDIGYQKRKVILVGVGGSYDYSGCGATHHCPADVSLIYNVPGFHICVPGHQNEVDDLLSKAMKDDKPYYFRLGETTNKHDIKDDLIAESIKETDTLVIAVGNIFDRTWDALAYHINANFLYVNEPIPLEKEAMYVKNEGIKNIIIVEPYYPVLHSEILRLIKRPVRILNIGVPRQFIHEYGKIKDIDKLTGLTVEGIRTQVEEFLNE